jgi:uncharacterized surface protein with fasciclin (FAS1) repeats
MRFFSITNSLVTHSVAYALVSTALPFATHAAPAASACANPPASKQAANDIVDTAIGAGSFNTLVAAVQAAGLVDALKQPGPYTVFAPTDAAFAKLPAGTVESLLKPENKDRLTAILLYHVVPSEVLAAKVVKLSAADTLNGQRVAISATSSGVKIDEANVSATDIKCTNGVIHVIDTVLIPSSKNIVETASATGSFATLLTAAQAAGLVDALQAAGPLTLFAPTDEAFAKLGPDTIAMLLKPENKQQLADILKYHVVSGRVYSDQAVKGAPLATLQGGTLKVTGGKVPKVEKATILTADVDTANGVIHIIDAVLMPPVK